MNNQKLRENDLLESKTTDLCRAQIDRAACNVNIDTPKPIIVLEDMSNQCIYIQTNKIYMKDDTIDLGDTYRSILFINCVHIKIIVRNKILSINCVDCERCHLYIETPVICNLSLLRYNNGYVYINDVVPMVNMNLCHTLMIHTKIGLVIAYVVSTCMEITYHSHKNKHLHNSIEEPLPVNIFNNPIVLFHLEQEGMVKD